VKPSAMAEAKKRPWIMQTLLHRGPDDLGTTAEQHEAAIEIVEAFAALTRVCAFRSAAMGALRGGYSGWANDLGARQVRLVAIYLSWAQELFRRCHLRGPVVVEWVSMERALGCSHIPLLVRSLDLWTKHRDEWRPPKLTSTIAGVLTARTSLSSCDTTPSQHRHANPSTTASRSVAQAS